MIPPARVFIWTGFAFLALGVVAFAAVIGGVVEWSRELRARRRERLVARRERGHRCALLHSAVPSFEGFVRPQLLQPKRGGRAQGAPLRGSEVPDAAPFFARRYRENGKV